MCLENTCSCDHKCDIVTSIHHDCCQEPLSRSLLKAELIFGLIMAAKKLTRQIKRKQVLAKQQYPSWQWMFHEAPTRLLFVGNGGIKTGVSHRLILALLSEEPRHVYMPFECDFAILEFSDSRQCESELTSLNGCCVQEEAEKRGARHLVTPLLTSPPLHLFLSYLVALPSPAIVEQDLIIRGCSSNECLPPGCHLLCDFLNKDEEAKLIDFFGLEQLDSVSTFQKTPGNVTVVITTLLF